MTYSVAGRNAFFIITSVFIVFIVMLFSFINTSNLMYKNVRKSIALEQAQISKHILELSMETPDDLADNDFLQRLFETYDFYPPLLSFAVYRSGKLHYITKNSQRLENLFDPGTISTTETVSFRVPLTKSQLQGYFIIIPLKHNGAYAGSGCFLFNISRTDDTFLEERKILYIIVLVFSVLIMIILLLYIFHLVKKVHEYEKNIQKYSRRDKITGLLNKETFFSRLRKELDRIELQQNGNLTLLVADIDDFFNINELFGYEFGDIILQNIASFFNETFRTFDFIGRLGGDELIISMVDTDETVALYKAEECRLKIRENKYYYEGKEITIKVSFGIASVASIKPEELSPDETGLTKSVLRKLLYNALEALSHSKKTGKDRCTVANFIESEDQKKS